MISLKASMTCRSKSYVCLAMRSAVFITFLPARGAQCRFDTIKSALSSYMFIYRTSSGSYWYAGNIPEDLISEMKENRSVRACTLILSILEQNNELLKFKDDIEGI